jgi:hypothetical protein
VIQIKVNVRQTERQFHVLVFNLDQRRFGQFQIAAKVVKHASKLLVTDRRGIGIVRDRHPQKHRPAVLFLHTELMQILPQPFHSSQKLQHAEAKPVLIRRGFFD